MDCWELCICLYTSFYVKLFLLLGWCLLCYLVTDPAQTPPVGTKWHLVCRDAKDELDIMSRPCLPPMAQHSAPLGLILLGQACSETEQADLILPAGQIMRNFGISSGSLSHLHSLRMECEELHWRRGITHLENNPSFVPLPLSEQDYCVFTQGSEKKSNYSMCSSKVVDVKSVNSIYTCLMREVRREENGYLLIMGRYGNDDI